MRLASHAECIKRGRGIVWFDANSTSVSVVLLKIGLTAYFDGLLEIETSVE